MQETDPQSTPALWEMRLRRAFRDFRSACASRAGREKEVERRFRQESQVLEGRLQDEVAALERRFERDRLAREEQAAAARRELNESCSAEQRRRAAEIAEGKQETIRKYVHRKERARTEFKEARWTITTMNDADRKVARDRVLDLHRRVRAVMETLDAQEREGTELLQRWGLEEEANVPDSPAPPETVDPWNALQRQAALSRETLESIRRFRFPRLLKGRRPFLLSAMVWAAAASPGILFPDSWHLWILGAALAVLPLGYVLILLLRRDLRRRAQAAQNAFADIRRQARHLRRECLRLGREEYRNARRQSKEKHQAALRAAGASTKAKIKDFRRRRQENLDRIRETLMPRLARAREEQERREKDLEEGLHRDISEAAGHRDREIAAARVRFKAGRDENNRRHAREWTGLLTDWKDACDRFQRETRFVAHACRQAFPSWEAVGAAVPAGVPAGLPFGSLEVRPDLLEYAIPEDPHLPQPDLDPEEIPALLPFPARASWLLLAPAGGRPTALRGLEALLLRCWTGLPPGSVRCTLVDPVGRGEHFAAFSHLADQDDRLLDGRIWTESGHIDQKLADLTAHMETVLQKHLRNRFETLADYNAQAGEMAEPFRFLVVAHFPTNFTAEAARRLISLAAAGSRCGVYVFILADPEASLPHGVDLGDLEAVCTVLDWRGERFGWNDEDFGGFPLTLASPPAAEICTDLLRRAGERAKERLRVQVPFERIAAPESEWWQADSRSGLSVPLGRAGALRLLEFSLGKGIAQHALIAGQTGSGKSTLLHVLILQLATRYAPEEVELYLIDFKKGVEFEAYASNGLPHARVIAVESEREFGLSVLQKLDAELVRRGEAFRAAGVNDLEAYRFRNAARSLPRIVLIVDEFQEFFVEEDRLAQEAALLLDRLVRQGRAFGMHILLGSQTLGGAYSLARSTIDQMAVRVALQCGEVDAHLILGRDNTEARLLSRPGEAIYNPAGGAVEANRLFQVAWLTDRQREEYLLRLRRRTRHDGTAFPEPIVFAGNQAADPARCRPLLAHLVQPAPLQEPEVLRAWLGDPVAIQDPTHVSFARQAGGNLLVIGADPEAALGILLAAALSLAAQQPRPAKDVHRLLLGVAPGEHPEVPLDDLLRAMPVQRHPQRDLPSLLADLHALLQRRLQGETGPSLFLYLFGLQRLRDLRKPEDDFSFSRRGDDQPPTPHRQFADLLREGPAVGLHVLAWCDGLASWQRSFDRTLLREFDLRVLLRMNAADSSTLIDSPAAAKLAAHRALLYLEDQGRLEKFRPYGLPALDWVRRVFGGSEPSLSAPSTKGG